MSLMRPAWDSLNEPANQRSTALGWHGCLMRLGWSGVFPSLHAGHINDFNPKK